jgi:hypothetical protein
MMKKALFALTLLLLFALNCLAQQDCQRHRETEGGFSICVPEGWTVKASADDKFKMIYAPQSGVFTSNINFKEETSAAPLGDYVAAGIKELKSNIEKIGATSIKVISQSDFTTASNLRGVKVVFSTEYKGIQFRQLQYLFDAGGNRKLVVTCTGLEKDQQQLDPVFDRAAKSFQLDR